MSTVVEPPVVSPNAGPIREPEVTEEEPRAPRLVRRSVGAVRVGGRVARHAAALTREVGVVTVGGSSIAPAKGDKRFADPAWEANPLYRRLMQAYLAFSEELDEFVEEGDLSWRDRELARFAANALSAALAPTNTLLGNPAALKRTFDTAGTNLLLGARNFLQDVRSNGGMPSQVKRGALRVGEDLAMTEGSVVYRDDVLELIQYKPTTKKVRERPVLLVPPQIGKYYFMDLRPGRSFIEHQVSQGLQIFVVSWRNPGPEMRDWNLDVYASSVLRAIDAVREITGSEDVNLLGMCAGGILSSIITAYLADVGDTRVHSLSLGVTLLDFDTPAPVGMFNIDPVVGVARGVSSRAGVLGARQLGAVFAWMRPNDLVFNYVVNNYLMGEDPPVFDILAWNADGTNLPSALHHQFLKIFNFNQLPKGELQVLGSKIDLRKIKVDLYATGATTDHLTPWKGCYAATQLMSGDATFVLSNAGHIASLINPPGNPKSFYLAGPKPKGDPEAWLEEAKEVRGTWWEHWSAWMIERSGAEVPAPEQLGDVTHPPLEPAPGRYVLRDTVPA
jgi:polyhydroxyalkanoate synthase